VKIQTTTDMNMNNLKFRGKNRDAGESGKTTRDSKKLKRKQYCPNSAKDIMILTLSLTVLALLYLEYIGAPWIEQKVNANLLEDHLQSAMNKFEGSINSRLESILNKVGEDHLRLKSELGEMWKNAAALRQQDQVQRDNEERKEEKHIEAEPERIEERQEAGGNEQQSQGLLEEIPNECEESGSIKVYDGYAYQTITGLSKDNIPEVIPCENTPTAIRPGWELAPPENDIIENVVRQHYWSSPQLYLSDLRRPKHTLLYGSDAEEDIPVIMDQDGKVWVDPKQCARGILIRRKCAGENKRL